MVKRNTEAEVKEAIFKIAELLENEDNTEENLKELDYLLLEVDDFLYASSEENLHLTKVITRFKRQRLLLSEWPDVLI